MADPELTLLEVKNLEFDPENPRLPDRLHGADEQAVIQFMLEEANIPELMMSIAENGYFWGEPLLAVRSAITGKYIVVEGNRRLTSLKLLEDPSKAAISIATVKAIKASAKFKLKSVPVLVFESRELILSYLGYRHITGIKEWDALAKARYLRQLRSTINQDDAAAHKELAKRIGSRASTVAKMLAGLNLLDLAEDSGILRSLKLEKEEIHFSLLTTGIGWENISEFIGMDNAADVDLKNINTDNLRELFAWTFYKPDGIKTKLGESRNFSKLSRIVKSEDALYALRRGDTLDAADTLTSGPLEAIRSSIQSAINSIGSAQVSLKYYPDLGVQDVDFCSELEAQAITLRASIVAIVNRRLENERVQALKLNAQGEATKGAE